MRIRNGYWLKHGVTDIFFRFLNIAIQQSKADHHGSAKRFPVRIFRIDDIQGLLRNGKSLLDCAITSIRPGEVTPQGNRTRQQTALIAQCDGFVCHLNGQVRLAPVKVNDMQEHFSIGLPPKILDLFINT